MTITAASYAEQQALEQGHVSGRAYRQRERAKVYPISRLVIVLLNIACLGSLFIVPRSSAHWALDITVRTWLGFLCTVMAHEGTHGMLGKSKRANYFWGRLALVPLMVPYTNFRKAHPLHHAHTNDPHKDPDHFMNVDGKRWQTLLRALAMPHYWFVWLVRNGRYKRADYVELVLNYAVLFAVHAAVANAVGLERYAYGVLPTLIFVSLILWYPFAYKTHEGFALSDSHAASHNYYGHVMYWLTLGLSMHRSHHQQQHLSWLELRTFVQRDPRPFWQRLIPTTDRAR